MRESFRLFSRLVPHAWPLLRSPQRQRSAVLTRWLAGDPIAHTPAEFDAVAALLAPLVLFARLELRGLTLLPLREVLPGPRDEGTLLGGEWFRVWHPMGRAAG